MHNERGTQVLRDHPSASRLVYSRGAARIDFDLDHEERFAFRAARRLPVTGGTRVLGPTVFGFSRWPEQPAGLAE